LLERPELDGDTLCDHGLRKDLVEPAQPVVGITSCRCSEGGPYVAILGDLKAADGAASLEEESMAPLVLGNVDLMK
jgi:hypothetical protein